MSTPHTVSAAFGAHPIIIETGKLANLADGAVTVRYADTLVIVTAVSATKIKEGQDFFPLTVEYRERAAAVGKIPGGYFKREGRPSEKEILTCRMTDRPLRPLFPKGYLYDTQIITTLLSADGENDPDILSINGASAALMVSDIPFAGPIGALRVGRIDGQFVTNPTHAQMELSDLDLVYVATETEILMIEGSALEMPEDRFQGGARLRAGGSADRHPPAKGPRRQGQQGQAQPAPLRSEARTGRPRLPNRRQPHRGAIYRPTKVERLSAVERPQGRSRSGHQGEVSRRHPVRHQLRLRPKSRKRRSASPSSTSKSAATAAAPTEIRPLTGEVGLLPRAHGSSLFARGETQALCLATLAPSDEAQELDGYTGGEISKRFILHYNFPPFSVGETGRVGGLNRREIGHGALAERSLLAVIPSENDFPYAIRVSSEVMASNGSTSMASVCGGCLALMDAGVPIKSPVAGISVGLVTEHDEQDNLKRYLLLADILGSEDHYGDMDFKLSGTKDGVTGFQLDLKLGGIPLKIMNEAIDQAKMTRAQDPRLHADGHQLAAHRALAVRPAHRDHPDQPGKNRPRHRPRRQEHQEHRRRDRRGN